MTFTMGMKLPCFTSRLPHRTYCFDSDKPAGSAKHKDRLTLLIITNMDGSDHRKLSVIGKSKTPRCLQKKYKMQVKDMSVDWYASKNAWMTGEIHHQIMTKLNNEMRLSNRHILYVCDNASSHQVREYSHIKFLMLPPNATSIMQPLDQGIILSAKRRYKKKLAERYLACVRQLEAQVVAMQFSLCSKQKQMQDYFQSSPRAPTPSKEPRARTPAKEARARTPAKEARAPTPIKDVSFKTVADVTKRCFPCRFFRHGWHGTWIDWYNHCFSSYFSPYEGNSNSLLHPKALPPSCKWDTTFYKYDNCIPTPSKET